MSPWNTKNNMMSEWNAGWNVKKQSRNQTTRQNKNVNRNHLYRFECLYFRLTFCMCVCVQSRFGNNFIYLLRENSPKKKKHFFFKWIKKNRWSIQCTRLAVLIHVDGVGPVLIPNVHRVFYVKYALVNVNFWSESMHAHDYQAFRAYAYTHWSHNDIVSIAVLNKRIHIFFFFINWFHPFFVSVAHTRSSEVDQTPLSIVYEFYENRIFNSPIYFSYAWCTHQQHNVLNAFATLSRLNLLSLVAKQKKKKNY